MFCGLIYREATEHNMNDPTIQAHIANAVSGEVTLVKPTASSSSDAMLDEDVAPKKTISEDATSLGDYVVTDVDILKIHNAIHSKDATVTINGVTFGIQMNDSSCRYVRVERNTLHRGWDEDWEKTNSVVARLIPKSTYTSNNTREWINDTKEKLNIRGSIVLHHDLQFENCRIVEFRL